MPHNSDILVKDIPSKIYYNEEPRTKFIDEILAIKVNLEYYPDKDKIYKLLANVANVSWQDEKPVTDKEKIKEVVERLLKGNTLLLGIEMFPLTFRIENISRIQTHMFVRNRVGFTYSQMSTGNSDLRHCNIVVPRILSKFPKLYEEFKLLILNSKMLYAKMLDTKEISVQDARAVLTQYNTNTLYISCNLLSFINMYAKRADTCEEPIATNVIVEKMKQELLKQFPELESFIKSACEKGTCLLSKDSPANSVYKPDEMHDKYVYNINNFIHQKTRTEMSYVEEPIETECYIGLKRIQE